MRRTSSAWPTCARSPAASPARKRSCSRGSTRPRAGRTYSRRSRPRTLAPERRKAPLDERGFFLLGTETEGESPASDFRTPTRRPLQLEAVVRAALLLRLRLGGG